MGKKGVKVSKLNDRAEEMDSNNKLIDRVKFQIECNGETNDWEDEFLSSILRQLMDGKTLTVSQVKKLEQIEDIEVNGRDYGER